MSHSDEIGRSPSAGGELGEGVAHPAGEHHDHHHPAHVAHHFDTAGQQFSSGKLGMWLFLATEVLFFGGLFVFYSVWRANHPEIFELGSTALDWKLGAVNTVVLILSSFTMAWGVTAAQQGKIPLLKILLALTILGGATFMVIKYFEYAAKISHGTVWGRSYHGDIYHLMEEQGMQPWGDRELMPLIGPADAHGHGEHGEADHPPEEADAAHLDDAPPHAAAEDEHAADAPESNAPAATDDEAAAAAADATAGPTRAFVDHAGWDPYESADVEVTHSQIEPADSGPQGLAENRLWVTRRPVDEGDVRTYFSIYFCLTGLHGVHVLVGMGLIGWILFRTTRGEFGPQYFTPVDLVGLYWHLVDLIWIFLFPLLYLI